MTRRPYIVLVSMAMFLPSCIDVLLLRQCGGSGETACEQGAFCVLDVGVCEEANAEGTCWPIPLTCDVQDTPVCGCDGQTYANDCLALQAQVNIASNGECPQ